MSLRSAIYLGRVRHRRREPVHEFTFPLFMLYLDLDEMDRVFGLSRFWGTSGWCPARFRRGDYLVRGELGLAESVRSCVEERAGFRPSGPIRMLTHLRYFGHIFNPVTFYYCFDSEERPSAIVAEITNTPWKERHAYALDVRRADRVGKDDSHLRWQFAKEFHVSPFLPMNLEYDWTFDVPGESLFVHMDVRDRRGEAPKAFDATLRMERRELSASLLRGLLIRYPLMTAQVVASIHYHALRLWLKRAAIFRHPRSSSANDIQTSEEKHA